VRLALIPSAAVLLAATIVSAAMAQTAVAQAPLEAMIVRYSADHDLLATVYSDPLSPAYRERMTRFGRTWHSQLEAVDFKQLDREGQLDYLLFENHLTREEHALQLQTAQWEAEAPLLPFAVQLFALEDAKRTFQTPSGEQAAGQLVQMRAALEREQKQLEGQLATAPSAELRATAWHAASDLDQMREQLAKWFNFSNGYDPAFSWWVAAPYRELDGQMKTYARFLRERVAGIGENDKSTLVGVPVGRAALLNQLHDEMIPYSPEELIAMAKEQMAWCQQQMLVASRAMGYGDDWHKALEKVKQMYVEPGHQPELIRNLARESEAYVVANHLVTVDDLARESWRMEMMTPQQQLVNPFFTGGDTITVSYPTDTMSYDQRRMSLRGNNIPFSHATVFHELIPGHWLQQYSTMRYRPYRQIFGTGFWIEGNALYWEMLFWDRGFNQTPEQRVGALFWRMHRCARIVFSLSFQLGQMSAQQAVDYLIAEVGHEPDSAVAEVRRSINGSYDPLYQSAYLIGAMQFRALRHELVDSHRMSELQFHDAILHENMMPVELLRALLEAQPLSPNYQPQWRFLDSSRSALPARTTEVSR
jgi:uncharacterized protein (DUF885 family)